MNKVFENENQSGRKKQYQPEDLSLKGYYGIAALSVTTGIVIVGILNLATPLEIIADRLALVSRFSGPLFLLLIPPFIFIPAILVLGCQSPDCRGCGRLRAVHDAFLCAK